MPTVDDELTRRFQEAERPVDGDGVFEGLVARRSRRDRVRRIQVGLVGFAVLAATAGGFAVLRDAFDADVHRSGESPSPAALPANGQIVFVQAGKDLRLHIYASRPDGTEVRQLTEGNGHDTHPAVSPDGRTIAFSHHLPGGTPGAIATIPIDGGPITWRFGGYPDVGEPAWSPDGTRIAFVGYGVDRADLYVADVGTDHVRRIPLPGGDDATQAHPSWSPDGSRIAIALDSDILIVEPDGTDPKWIVETIDTAEFAPAWSPDGTRIAFLSSSDPEGIATDEVLPNEIRTIAPDGGSTTLIATAPDADLGLDLDWAPDGTALLVSDLDWIYRVDPKPDGDPKDNFVQMMKGFAPSWQPLPEGIVQEVTPSPEPTGRDIGLGVRMCDLEVLDGVDWDGTGINGAAWTGAPVDEDGRCSSSAAGVQHVVAVDRDGDGIAEQGSTSTLRSCLLCRPFDTVDLNDDGVLELVVLEEASSTPTYSVYEVNRPGSERSPGIYPIIVVAPGAPAMNLDKNEAVRFTVGGDEGFSGSIVCEDGGAGAPILRYTWVRGAVDADTELRVDITRLSFGEDGVFHIKSVDRFGVPRSPEPTDLKSTGPACGVDFHPAA